MFYKDMGAKPEGSYLCRRDENRPFDAENCYWGTGEERSRRATESRSRPITAWSETKRIGEWAKDPRCAVSALELRNRVFFSAGRFTPGKTWEEEISTASIRGPSVRVRIERVFDSWSNRIWSVRQLQEALPDAPTRSINSALPLLIQAGKIRKVGYALYASNDAVIEQPSQRVAENQTEYDPS